MILIDLQEHVKQTLDQITQTYANTNQIIGLVKESGRITDYQLSNNTIAEKQQAVDMAKYGQIASALPTVEIRNSSYPSPPMQ